MPHFAGLSRPNFRGGGLTIIAATTVCQNSRRGESHGGVYLIDIGHGRGAHRLDWSHSGIDWDGDVGGRGLRGIEIEGDRVFIATAESLLEFSAEFELLRVHRTSYLGDAQQMHCHDGRLYVCSAAFDAVLAFDAGSGRFDHGLHIIDDEAGLRARPFDPSSALGPGRGNRLGLASLWCDARGLFVTGVRTTGMLHFDGRRIVRVLTLPEGVRDARPWRDGVLFNDSAAGCTRFLTPSANRVFPVPRLPAGSLEHELEGSAGFVRGLLVLDDHRFVAGSAPFSITLHDLDAMRTTLNFNLAVDARISVHSLVAWPFTPPPDD